MPKLVITQEKYDEKFNELTDLVEFFVTAMETSSTRVLQTLRERLPEDKRPRRQEDSPFGDPYNLVPRLSEMFGYDSDSLNHDEREQFEYGSDISNLRQLVYDIAKANDNVLRRIKDYTDSLEKCKAHQKTRLPVDRKDQYGTVLSERGYETIIKTHITKMRKALNPYGYTEITVSRDVVIKAQSTTGGWHELHGYYTPSQRKIHKLINKGVRQEFVKIKIQTNSRYKGDPVDENVTSRDDGMVIWTNPDENVHAKLAFTEL